MALESPASQPVDMLLEDHHYAIDKTGRLRYEVRKVYKVLLQEDEGPWSTVEEEYQPWREQKPRIRARVIAKDGSVHWLDPKTLTDSPAREFESSVFSDRRVVRAPLPAVAPGAVVEYEVACEVEPALPEAGITRRVTVLDNIPLERFHVRMEVAKGGPQLRTVARLIPDSAIRRQTGAETRLEVELGPFPARKEFESNLPADVPNFAYLAFSTAPSWSVLAARYSEIVEQQIRGADLKPLLEGVDLTGAAPAVAARLANRLHKDVRYTGVELAESAIIPAPPAEVLKRKYGDCKDKSTLLVATLRAAGLKAHVALLNAGPGKDVDEELPGIDLFDHAIVYVENTPPLWIDATASETHIGAIPPADQGRLALIAASTTAGLAKTAEPLDSWQRRTFEIRFSDFGSGAITETMEATDSDESALRNAYGGDQQKARESLEKYVKTAYSAKALGKFSVSGRDDLGSRFAVSVEATETPQVFTGDDGAQVELGPWTVLNELPYALRKTEKDEGEKPSPRKNEFYLGEAVNVERIYRLHPPPLFKPGTLPEAKEEKYGPLTWTRTYRSGADGTVEVAYTLKSAKRRLTAHEFDDIAKALPAPTVRQNDVIRFFPATAEYLATGQTAKALAVLREDLAQHEQEAASHIRMARTLLNAGMGGAAKAEARQATGKDPRSSQAWQTLGWTMQHDVFGRRFAGDWNMAEAEKSYRQALEIDPEDAIARMDLAILLEHNTHGVRYGRGARLDEAIALYRETLAKRENPAIRGNLTAALMMAGRIDEALEETRNAAAPNPVITAVHTAVHDGVARAIVELQSQYPDPATRAQQTLAVGLVLLRMRRYDDGRSMLAAAARASNGQQLAPMVQLVSGLKKREDVVLPETDPRSVAQRLMLEVFSGEADKDRLAKMFTRRESFVDFEEGMGDLRSSMAPFQRQFGLIGLSEDNLLDLLISMMSLKTEGDDGHGYRLATQLGPNPLQFYVTREDGAWKILGDSTSPEHVGELVLDLLDQKQIERAQWWLDKVANDLRRGPKDAAEPAAKEIWSGLTPESRGPDVIRAAAAGMIGRFTKSPRAIRILEEQLPKAKNATDKAQIYAALCEAYLKTEDWERLKQTARGLGQNNFFANDAFQYLQRTARAQKRWKELEDTATARLNAKTSVTIKPAQNNGPSTVLPDPEVARALITAKVNLGDFKGAKDWIAKLKDIDQSQARAFEAWVAVLSKTADATMLADAGPAAAGASGLEPFAKAAVQLAVGRTDDARDSLRLMMKDDEFDEFDARVWVLHGLVAREYGLADEAGTLWDRARKAKNQDDTAEWSLALIPR